MKKSTLKIATESAGTNLTPVIKIVQPAAQFNFDPKNLEEDDPIDDLIRTFLHTPCMVDRNEWFRLYTHFPVPMDGVSPTHYVTTIAPLNERCLFENFKNAILGRVIPYEDHVKINRGEIEKCDNRLAGTRKTERIDLSIIKHNKICDFFAWLESAGYCSWKERQPDFNKAEINSAKYEGAKPQNKSSYILETIRDYFELSLEQGERMNAFENTPFAKLDLPVKNVAEAFEKAFDIKKSPQGAEYWQKVINRIAG